MPLPRVILRMQETPRRMWAPLIGSRFTEQLIPRATLFLGGAVLMLLGIVGMLVLIGLSSRNVAMILAGFVVGALGLAAWAVPWVLIDRLGVRMSKELAKAGLIVDRRPPIHSPYLYQQWLKRSGLTAAEVIAALD